MKLKTALRLSEVNIRQKFRGTEGQHTRNADKEKACSLVSQVLKLTIKNKVIPHTDTADARESECTKCWKNALACEKPDFLLLKQI